MKTIRELLEIYDRAGILTDEELKRVNKFYQTISILSDDLGSEFSLFKTELHRRAERLKYSGIK